MDGCVRYETRTSAYPFAGTGCQKLSPSSGWTTKTGQSGISAKDHLPRLDRQFAPFVQHRAPRSVRQSRGRASPRKSPPNQLGLKTIDLIEAGHDAALQRLARAQHWVIQLDPETSEDRL